MSVGRAPPRSRAAARFLRFPWDMPIPGRTDRTWWAYVQWVRRGEGMSVSLPLARWAAGPVTPGPVGGGGCQASWSSASPRPRAARASPVCRAKATVVMNTGSTRARGFRSSPRARAESRTPA
jgi:hypothetical protein